VNFLKIARVFRQELRSVDAELLLVFQKLLEGELFDGLAEV
jgi:hypothetical protein